jgi:hypothetical protein
VYFTRHVTDLVEHLIDELSRTAIGKSSTTQPVASLGCLIRACGLTAYGGFDPRLLVRCRRIRDKVVAKPDLFRPRDVSNGK